MITFVNNVFVSNKNGNSLATATELKGAATAAAATAAAGKFVFMNCDSDVAEDNLYVMAKDCQSFKLGVVMNEANSVVAKDGTVTYVPRVKWSNVIRVADIKSISKLTYADDTEDTVTIDFAKVFENDAVVKAGGAVVVLRLQFKDLPTRYRQWSESYDAMSKAGDDGSQMAKDFAATIIKNAKRQRVHAKVEGTKLILTAMTYDDDLANNTENPVAKVRFNVNLYYQNPSAPGFAASNKYATSAEISKVPGKTYEASAKIVREHEHNAWGYEGVLNREAWYDRTPAINTNIDFKYGGIVIEFENAYHTADDLTRNTKQTIELYASDAGTALAPDTIAGAIVASATSASPIAALA